jgi:hypothetical protein
MDWSFFKPNSRYPLLRSELVYTNALPVRNLRSSPHFVLNVPRSSFIISRWSVHIAT